jgi:hypothetical protein
MVKGAGVRTAIVCAVFMVLLAGCGSSDGTPTAVPTSAGTSPTAAPSGSSTPVSGPTATVVLEPAYMSFVRSLCNDFKSGNASGVTGRLMNYQYNTGLRWGMFGDGEGHTSDPSLMTTWLTGAHVHCTELSPSTAGHGTLMTAGWTQPGRYGLLDLDLLNGEWKINDFTFGSEQQMARAMHQVVRPIIAYTG